MTKIMALLVFAGLSAAAQTPSPDAIAVSLKTMNKTLASCKVTYTRVLPGHKDPMFQELLGKENYSKDVSSLDHALKFGEFLISNPGKISGGLLVMIMSTSDDFAVGLQSTQTEILRNVIVGGKPHASTESILVALDSLSDCQHRLFDAGDDYVDLVTKYIEAEDRALGKYTVPAPD